MRTSLLAVFLGASVSCFVTACTNTSLPDVTRGGPAPGSDSAVAGPLPASLKGYELYAWSAEDGLHFTLTTGTNRAKTLQEVMVEDARTLDGDWVVLSGTGASGLETQLARVPAGTSVVLASLDGLPALTAEHAEVVARLVAKHAAASVSDAGGEPASDKLRACPELAGRSTSSAGVCTEIGCSDGFTLSVLPRSAWPQGAYRFAITIDERVVTCKGSLPLATCEKANVSCNGSGVAIGESGCALPASQHAFADMRFDGFPAHVHVEVFRDDTRVAQADVTPAYTGRQPNGPGCAPLCCNASAQLSLDR